MTEEKILGEETPIIDETSTSKEDTSQSNERMDVSVSFEDYTSQVDEEIEFDY